MFVVHVPGPLELFHAPFLKVTEIWQEHLMNARCFVTVSSVRGIIQKPIKHTQVLLLQVTCCTYSVIPCRHFVNANTDKQLTLNVFLIVDVEIVERCQKLRGLRRYNVNLSNY